MHLSLPQEIKPYLTAAILILSLAKLTGCQYNSGYHMANSHHGASYNGPGGYADDAGGNEVDDRPKVQLGIRLKIPAFKFELPRFNLPKVTISAKIRQPDRPRTINLPEINLDTSSRLSPPGMKMGQHGNGGQGYSMSNGDYGAGSTHQSYSAPSHDGGYGNDGSISLSASSEESDAHGRNYGPQNQRHHEQHYHRQQQRFNQQYQGPTYQMATSNNGMSYMI